MDPSDTLSPFYTMIDPGLPAAPVADATSAGMYPLPPVYPFNNPPGAPVYWIFYPFVLASPYLVYETQGGGPAQQLPLSGITDISLAIDQAYFPKPFPPNTPIPTAGHLYIGIWSKGFQVGDSYEAGPTVTIRTGQNCTTIFNQGCLGPQDYSSTEHPATDYHLFLSGIPPVVAASCLVRNASFYATNWVNWPGYNPLVMNSNSYADALLLSCGYSQAYLNALEDKMIINTSPALDPFGAFDGQKIVSLF